MNILTAPGRTVAYDDAGNGPPLVLLHAYPLSREMWRPQVAALAKDFRVLTPDLPGFGGTDGFVGEPSVDGMAMAVGEFLEALSITQPVALGGLSMGGYVALAFSRRYPARLRALILADTKAEPDDATGKANRDKAIAFALEHSAADVIEQMMPKMLGESTRTQRPEVVAEVKRIASTQSIDGIVNTLKALRDRPDSRPGLDTVTAPTLVLVGAEDAITPPALSQNMAAKVRGTLEIIPGAGHLSNLERPDVFNDAVRRFLAGLGSA
jgi:3-oxoadipate enol-lactonase